jgi:hypothetical protein
MTAKPFIAIVLLAWAMVLTVGLRWLRRLG